MINNLPNGWKLENISDIFKLKQGNHLSMNDLEEDGYFVYGANGIIGKYHKYMYEDSKVLITCRGATCGTINISKPKSWITGNAIALTEKKDYIDENYIAYFLRKDKLQSVISGSAQPQITATNLSKLKIPIPPLQQQEKIVKVLDLTSDLIEKQKELLEKYDLFLKSKFIEMFGDPISNLMGWEVVSFNKLATIKTKSIKAEDITNEIYIGLDCIEKDTGKLLFSYNSENEEVKSNKYIFTSNMLLYGKLRPYLNKVLLPKFDGICSTDILPIEPIKNKSTKEYLAYFLRNTNIVEILSNSVSGANLPRVSPQIIKELKIMEIPIELQNKFASIVEKIEIIKEKENQKLKQLEDLHNSMMNKAFKGEIK